MIDFAKTAPIAAKDARPSHRAPWAEDNHEDGYLIGLDSLIQMFASLASGELLPP